MAETLEQVQAERKAWHCAQPGCDKPLEAHVVTLAEFVERERAATR